MYSIDINCDLGESFGAYQLGNNPELLKYISSANIACGFHAGDPKVIFTTLIQCVDNNVKIGAHPGFNDLVGFGRREMHIHPDELYCDLLYQIGALKAMTESMGTKLQHVKPHGALYNMAAKNKEYALTICKVIKALDSNLILFGLPNSEMSKQAQAHNIAYIPEFFADRNYNSDGSLVSRNDTNAVIKNTEDNLTHVVRMIKENKIKTIDNQLIPSHAKTICVHGDNDKALQYLIALNKRLEEESILVKPFN